MIKLRMDWKFSQNDIKNLEKGINLFSKFVKKSAIGHLSSSALCTNLLESAELSRHHIGTTRMSKDLNSGVVDHNCKVHDIDNLYIAGASVFPTNALANPTLSILALAIRLSEQLKAAI